MIIIPDRQIERWNVSSTDTGNGLLYSNDIDFPNERKITLQSPQLILNGSGDAFDGSDIIHYIDNEYNLVVRVSGIYKLQIPVTTTASQYTLVTSSNSTGTPPPLNTIVSANRLGTKILLISNITLYTFDMDTNTWATTTITFPLIGTQTKHSPHPIEAYPLGDGFMVGDYNSVKLYSTTFLLKSSISIQYTPYGLISGLQSMGIIAKNGSDSIFATWDGSPNSATLNGVFPTGASDVYGRLSYSGGTWVILTSDGRLKKFNGAGFVTMAEFPWSKTPLQWSPPQQEIFIGAVTYKMPMPRSMTAYLDNILINISNKVEDTATGYYKGFSRGLWVYDTQIGLYNYNANTAYNILFTVGTPVSTAYNGQISLNDTTFFQTNNFIIGDIVPVIYNNGVFVGTTFGSGSNTIQSVGGGATATAPTQANTGDSYSKFNQLYPTNCYFAQILVVSGASTFTLYKSYNDALIGINAIAVYSKNSTNLSFAFLNKTYSNISPVTTKPILITAGGTTYKRIAGDNWCLSQYSVTKGIYSANNGSISVSGNNKVYSNGSFTTTKLGSENIKTMWGSVKVKHTNLTDGNKIDVYYAESFSENLPDSIRATSYSTTSNKLSLYYSLNYISKESLGLYNIYDNILDYLGYTTTSDSFFDYYSTNYKAGDTKEVYCRVLNKEGVIKYSKVLSIFKTVPSTFTRTWVAYLITFEDQIDTRDYLISAADEKIEPFIFEFVTWKKAGTINKETTSNYIEGYTEIPINVTSKWIRLKLELSGIGTSIEEILIDNQPYK